MARGDGGGQEIREPHTTSPSSPSSQPSPSQARPCPCPAPVGPWPVSGFTLIPASGHANFSVLMTLHRGSTYVHHRGNRPRSRVLLPAAPCAATPHACWAHNDGSWRLGSFFKGLLLRVGACEKRTSSMASFVNRDSRRTGSRSRHASDVSHPRFPLRLDRCEMGSSLTLSGQEWPPLPLQPQYRQLARAHPVSGTMRLSDGRVPATTASLHF